MAPEHVTTPPAPAPTDVGRTLFGLVRAPGRRAAAGVLLGALLLAGICWYLGADVWHSILVGGVLATVAWVGLVVNATPDLITTAWRGSGHTNREGARNEIAELSWSLRGSYGRVGTRAVRRVQQIGRHRLALHQLNLRDPADRDRIERLIGHRAYAVLVRTERRPPLLRSLLHCLDMLEALDPARPTTAPSRSRRPRPIFAFHLPRRARER
jgi:hypothetical protein